MADQPGRHGMDAPTSQWPFKRPGRNPGSAAEPYGQEIARTASHLPHGRPLPAPIRNNTLGRPRAARTDVEEQIGPVLILTPRCLRAVLAPEPGSAQLTEALTTRRPGITVAAFLPPNGVPRLLSMDRLNVIIQYRLRKMRLASEVNSGCQSDDPRPDFPALA